MEKEDFVDRIKEGIYISSVDGAIDRLKQPPGRRPRKKLVALSAWYNQLPPEDQINIEDVVRDACKFAIFNFLCVLDGVDTIENTEEKGSFELYYVKAGKRQLLNDEVKMPLHDLFNVDTDILQNGFRPF